MKKNSLEIFNERLKNSHLWFSKAEELIFVANILKNKINSLWREVLERKGEIFVDSSVVAIQEIYFMLTAFAIENFCKGIIVNQKEKEWEPKRFDKIPDILNNHDLLRLIKYAKLGIDLVDEEILEKLSRYAIWNARYHLPQFFNAIEKHKTLSDGSVCHVAHMAFSDLSHIEDIVRRLSDLAKKHT
jgi:hypothetical protein